MKIPRSFQLHGTTYSVRISSVADWVGDELEVGYFDPQRCEVVIKEGNQQLMEHTFFHELVHAILNAQGENELYNNEKFVDPIGGLLHQALNSSAYK